MKWPAAIAIAALVSCAPLPVVNPTLDTHNVRWCVPFVVVDKDDVGHDSAFCTDVWNVCEFTRGELEARGQLAHVREVGVCRKAKVSLDRVKR